MCFNSNISCNVNVVIFGCLQLTSTASDVATKISRGEYIQPQKRLDVLFKVQDEFDHMG